MNRPVWLALAYCIFALSCGDTEEDHCKAGFTGPLLGQCIDINECAVRNGGCDALSTCTNTVGGRTCGECPAGYSGTGEKGCIDINECTTANGGCGTQATCTNTRGSHICGADCASGYTGSPGSECIDVNE